MKYCVDYYRNLTDIDKADEYTIRYSKKDDILITFLEENKNKIINLTIEEKLSETNYKTLKAIYNTFSNFRLKFESYDSNEIENIVECGIPFFFGNRVNNWDEFLGLIELGVTDIYIVEDLCFDLERVAAAAHKENIKLRTYANVAQSTWHDTPEIKKFWIRPEDVKIYEEYIDVLEFFGQPYQIPTILRVYKDEQKWFGALKEIIFGLESEDLDSRFIIPEFGKRRISCQKNCLKGGKCRICDRILSLSKTLKEADLIVKTDDNEN